MVVWDQVCIPSHKEFFLQIVQDISWDHIWRQLLLVSWCIVSSPHLLFPGKCSLLPLRFLSQVLDLESLVHPLNLGGRWNHLILTIDFFLLVLGFQGTDWFLGESLQRNVSDHRSFLGSDTTWFQGYCMLLQLNLVEHVSILAYGVVISKPPIPFLLSIKFNFYRVVYLFREILVVTWDTFANWSWSWDSKHAWYLLQVTMISGKFKVTLFFREL